MSIGTLEKPWVTHGPWLPTNYLQWSGRVLQQKMRRRVVRDYGHGHVSKTYEYEWQAVARVKGR